MSFGNQPGQVRFSDSTESSGIFRQGQTWGLSVFDFNQDGLPDIYQNNHQQKPVSLFLNQGENLFIDVASDVFPRRFPGDFHGAVGFDYDNDGDLDFFQGGGGDLRASDDNPNKSNRFLVQDNGQLVERAEELGIRYPLGRARMPAVFDFNDDGNLDVLFTAPRRPDFQSFATIFLQENGQFRNLGLDTGLATQTSNGTYGIFADVTGDFRQELIYVASSPKLQIYDTSELPLRELSSELIPQEISSQINVAKDIAIADFNGDAHNDILIVQQGTSNSGFRVDGLNQGRAHLEVNRDTKGLSLRKAGKLFLNFEGDPDLKLPTFIRNEVVVKPENIFIGARKINPRSLDFRLNPEKESSQGIPDFTPGSDFGVFIGFDTQSKQWRINVSAGRRVNYNFLFETELNNPTISTMGFSPNAEAKPDILLTYNPQSGQFEDTTEFSGLNRVKTASRNVVAEDFDNDGDRDIFLVATANTQNLPDVLFENLGNGQFRKVPGAAGAAGIREGIGDSAAVGDFNVDGFVDIVVNNGDALGPDRNFWLDGTNRYFQNQGNGNHSIQIDLQGTTVNRDAIGSKVYVTTADGKRQVREQNAGIHNRTQNFQRLHFGLGDQEVVQSIEVIWPNGETEIFEAIPADQVLKITQNQPQIETLFNYSSQPPNEDIVGTVENDRLSGSNLDNKIKGLAGDDILKGLKGEDTLIGGTGDDYLVGGSGIDLLQGGAGKDQFVFISGNQDRDRIKDFSPGMDEIVVKQTGFQRGLNLGTLPRDRFQLGNQAADRRDRFIYDPSQGNLWFDPDGSGSKQATLIATLDNQANLAARDILVM